MFGDPNGKFWQCYLWEVGLKVGRGKGGSQAAYPSNFIGKTADFSSDLLDMPAQVEITPEEIRVEFHRRAHLPIVLDPEHPH